MAKYKDITGQRFGSLVAIGAIVKAIKSYQKHIQSNELNEQKG